MIMIIIMIFIKCDVLAVCAGNCCSVFHFQCFNTTALSYFSRPCEMSILSVCLLVIVVVFCVDDRAVCE